MNGNKVRNDTFTYAITKPVPRVPGPSEFQFCESLGVRELRTGQWKEICVASERRNGCCNWSGSVIAEDSVTMQEGPSRKVRDPPPTSGASLFLLTAGPFYDSVVPFSCAVNVRCCAPPACDQHVLWNRSGTDSPCLLYTSPSPRDKRQSRMPSSA